MKFSKYNLILPGNPDDKDNFNFLFNTLTGHCFEIDGTTLKAIQKGNPEMLINTDVIKAFQKMAILVDDNTDETRIVSYHHNREKFASDAIASTVFLTWDCNLKCVYCFESTNQGSFNMSFALADRYISFMIKLSKSKRARSMSIFLFGGEPLLNIDVGFYILEKLKTYCVTNNIVFTSSIITNGTLINEDKIDKLIEYNCRSIQITLDGTKDIHDSRRMKKNDTGSFDSIINTLKLLNAKCRNIHTVIRINIDKSNLNETYDLIKYIGKSGIDLTNCTVDFGIVRNPTNVCSAFSGCSITDEDIGDVLNDLWGFAENEGFFYRIQPMRKHIYCGLYSDNNYSVSPECDIYKCWEHVGHKEHLMGNLDEKGNLVNIQYALYDWMSNNPLSNSDCYECVYLPACGGGCGVTSYNETKSYHSTGCFKIKGVVEKQVLKYIERVRKSSKK